MKLGRCCGWLRCDAASCATLSKLSKELWGAPKNHQYSCNGMVQSWCSVFRTHSNEPQKSILCLYITHGEGMHARAAPAKCTAAATHTISRTLLIIVSANHRMCAYPDAIFLSTVPPLLPALAICRQTRRVSSGEVVGKSTAELGLGRLGSAGEPRDRRVFRERQVTRFVFELAAGNTFFRVGSSVRYGHFNFEEYLCRPVRDSTVVYSSFYVFDGGIP